MKNIMLLSGGLDSKILLHYLKKHKKIENLISVFIHLNEINDNTEMNNAREQLKEFGDILQVINIDNIWTSQTKEVILRNLVFLLMGIIKNFKENEQIKIYYATHYPPMYDNNYYYLDCSPKFIQSLNIFFQSIGYNVRIITPFLDNTLYENIYHAYYDLNLNDYSDVHMCNVNKEINCGMCKKCIDVKENLIQFVEMEGVDIKFPKFEKIPKKTYPEFSVIKSLKMIGKN